MLLVGLIALLVFGPERLPKVAKEAALWIKKAKAMASSVKSEIDRELQLQELKETMDKQKREMEQVMLADLNQAKSGLGLAGSQPQEPPASQEQASLPAAGTTAPPATTPKPPEDIHE